MSSDDQQAYAVAPPSPKRRTPNSTPRTSTPTRLSADYPAGKPGGTPAGTPVGTPGRTKTRTRAKKWTSTEDDLLRKAVTEHGAKNWRAIADMVPGRSHTQCLQHWSKVLKPGLIKGNWTKDEDAKLAHLVRSFAPTFTQENFEESNIAQGFRITTEAAQTADWTYISNAINGRTTKQCRERWFHHLDPSLRHGPFDAQEDELLLAEHGRIGSKWSLIASRLPGRTADAVKIRHITLSRLRAAGRPLRPPAHQPITTAAPSFGPQAAGVSQMLNLPPDHPLHSTHMQQLMRSRNGQQPFTTAVNDGSNSSSVSRSSSSRMQPPPPLQVSPPTSSSHHLPRGRYEGSVVAECPAPPQCAFVSSPGGALPSSPCSLSITPTAGAHALVSPSVFLSSPRRGVGVGVGGGGDRGGDRSEGLEDLDALIDLGLSFEESADLGDGSSLLHELQVLDSHADLSLSVDPAVDNTAAVERVVAVGAKYAPGKAPRPTLKQPNGNSGETDLTAIINELAFEPTGTSHTVRP